MYADEFRAIRDALPAVIAKTNETLARVLGVTHHSISNYQNQEAPLPGYVANSMMMLLVICRNNLLPELLIELQPEAPDDGRDEPAALGVGRK